MAPRAVPALAVAFAFAVLAAAAPAVRPGPEAVPTWRAPPADHAAPPHVPVVVVGAQPRPQETGCLADVPDASGLGQLPGLLTEARSLLRTRERTVTSDNETTLHVIALVGALDERIALEDVLDYSEHRTEVCLFDRFSTFDGDTVLSALALGVTMDARELRRLVPDARVVMRFETEIFQEVDLDSGVALAALAAHGAGLEVHLEDVLTIRQSVRTERAFESTTDLDKDDALLALALQGADRPTGLR